MKTVKRITAVFLAVIMIMSLASCSLVNESDTDITNDTIKVGVLLSGTRDDKFGYSGICNASVKALTDLGYGINSERFKYAENIDPANTDSIDAGLKALLNNECNIIIATDPAFAAEIAKVSDANTAVDFLVFKGKSNGKNVFGYDANITGAAYLSGIVAAAKCSELKVAKIGFEALSENDLTVANAFFAGVKSIAPAATAVVTYGTGIKENTQKLVKAGCVLIASDFSSEDIAKECTENKISFCGFGAGDYGEYEEYYVCSPDYSFTQYFINTIKAVVDETAVTEFYGNMKTGSAFLSNVNSKAFNDSTVLSGINVSTKANEIYNGTLSIKVSATQLSADMEAAK